jgi:tetratricopeptide (TPR) repeat protein
MEIDEIYALNRADDPFEAELLALEFVDRHGLTKDVANALSLIYGSARDREKELHYAREAAQLAPDSPILIGNLGVSLADSGHLDEAIATLRRALSLDERLGYVYQKLGEVYRKKGDEVAALREYQQAIRCCEKSGDDNPSNLFVLRQLYHEIGEYDKSREFQSRLAEVRLNEKFQGDHRDTIAGPDSGF